MLHCKLGFLSAGQDLDTDQTTPFYIFHLKWHRSCFYKCTPTLPKGRVLSFPPWRWLFLSLSPYWASEFSSLLLMQMALDSKQILMCKVFVVMTLYALCILKEKIDTQKGNTSVNASIKWSLSIHMTFRKCLHSCFTVNQSFSKGTISRSHPRLIVRHIQLGQTFRGFFKSQ